MRYRYERIDNNGNVRDRITCKSIKGLIRAIISYEDIIIDLQQDKKGGK